LTARGRARKRYGIERAVPAWRAPALFCSGCVVPQTPRAEKTGNRLAPVARARPRLDAVNLRFGEHDEF
jgi:hypothetical protein